MQITALATNSGDPLATNELEMIMVLPYLTLLTLKDALANNTGYPFALYGWENATADTYGVVSLDGGAPSLWADCKMEGQTFGGTVDLFTRDPSQTPVQAVQGVLKGLDISWYLNSVQFEDDSGYIHHEWVWQVA